MLQVKNRKKCVILLLLLNIFIVVTMIVVFILYIHYNKQRLFRQNLKDIGNINSASAQIAAELSASQERKLNNILRYVSYYQLSQEELLRYVNAYNSDTYASFQLLFSDYTGYLMEKDDKGEFPTVDYRNKDYKQLQKIIDATDSPLDDIPITVEFTDNYSGSLCFGRYSAITVLENGEEKKCIILVLFRSEDFIQHINMNGGFDEMSTVLMNHDGSYALHSDDYKSDNFFQYLYVYNNLTQKKKMELVQTVQAKDQGTFQYLNSVGQKCVFVYSKVPDTGWYCVSSLPISAFRNDKPEIMFNGILFALFSCLMIVNIVYLYHLNLRLRKSVKAEHVANEAKTDFLSRMSHDIRTPINVISGMTELALLEQNPEQTTEYLKNIQSSGKYLLGQVNDILDMSKIESGNMELHLKPYCYKNFLIHLNTVIRPLCEEKSIEFDINSVESDLVIRIDALRFSQVLFNLLSNAVKFTSQKGHITFTDQIVKKENDKVAIHIEISDDGVGMSEEFQQDLFKPFSQEESTLEQNGTGTGLGLAIVKRIMDLMEGTIQVKSKQGTGTTFSLDFEAEIAKEEGKALQEEVSIAKLAGMHILLCEDHPLNTKIIVRMLERKSVFVDTAENGKIGLDKFLASKEHFYDAILMDIRMPVMNGLQASRAIRSHTEREDAAEIPIIALTANAYDSDIENCLNAGMSCHMAKPVELEKLCQVLASMIPSR